MESPGLCTVVGLHDKIKVSNFIFFILSRMLVLCFVFGVKGRGQRVIKCILKTSWRDQWPDRHLRLPFNFEDQRVFALRQNVHHTICCCYCSAINKESTLRAKDSQVNSQGKLQELISDHMITECDHITMHYLRTVKQTSSMKNFITTFCRIILVYFLSINEIQQLSTIGIVLSKPAFLSWLG